MSNPFAAETGSYNQVRPRYPQEAVEAAAAAPLRPLTAAADIGAGTGIFSRQLASAHPGVTIYSVEPAAQMRAGGDAQNWVNGTSENTTLPPASVDLMVWAQSFHWVDPRASGVEAARVLRPGGAAVVLFNQLDVSVPWVHRLTRIMRSGDVHRPDRPPRLDGFTPQPVQQFRWEQRMTPDLVMELARTRSSYLRANPPTQQRMQQNLRWYLHEHLQVGQEMTLPYFTYLWTLRV